jgi:hypothetical protein
VHFVRPFLGKRKYLFTDDWLFFRVRLDIVFRSDCDQLYFSSLVRVSDCFLVVVFLVVNDLFLLLSRLLQKCCEVVISVRLIDSEVAIPSLVLLADGCRLIFVLFLEKQIVSRSGAPSGFRVFL